MTAPARIEPVKVRAARREVDERKAALIATVRELQQRLQPRTLAGEAWQAAKSKGVDLAEGAVDAVVRRPYAIGGVAAVLAMFLARAPIRDAAARLYDGMTSSNGESGEPIAASAVPPVRRRTRKNSPPKTKAAIKPEKPE